MVYLSIILFFVYTFGLGFTITSFVKNSDNFLERNLMRFGFGLAFLPFLGLILNLLRIPLDWRLILVLSLVYPVYYLIRYRPRPKLQLKITKTTISILAMLVLFAINLYIYTSGAFNYPYLEDDDSWSHAMSVKFVSIEKTVFAGVGNPFHYIDPYPPTYDLLMGLLHQTNNSIYFTLKFFNALIISLSTIFFYFFVKEFSQNKNKALFATFALLSIPAFMSHFIWAISLAVPLYFVVFYALERIKWDKKWWIVATLSMATVLTATPTHSTYFGLFFVLYLVTKVILERKILIWHTLAGTLGLLLSFLFWWLPMILDYGLKGTIEGVGLNFRVLEERGIEVAFMGTGDKIYTLKDFFIAQKQNMINNPIGIGIFLSILTIVGLTFLFLKYKVLLKKENQWIVITLVWFIFTLYAVNASRFTIKLSPFRAWMLLAIPVCILAAHGFFFLIKKVPGIIYWGVLGIFEIFFIINIRNVIEVLYVQDLLQMLNQIPILKIIIFSSHRFVSWVLIPYIILISFLIYVILSYFNKRISVPKLSFSILLIMLIASSSGIPKYAVNTAQWPPGAFWTSGEEIGAYVWIRDNLPRNSHVFTFVNNGPVIGMDMYTCHWCKDVKYYMKNGFNQSAQETYDWLKSKKYEYIIFDGQTLRDFGLNESVSKMEGLAESGLFQPIFQNQKDTVIFKIGN